MFIELLAITLGGCKLNMSHTSKPNITSNEDSKEVYSFSGSTIKLK